MEDQAAGPRGLASEDALAMRRAAAVLAAGGVIAYPTEAVWGLGCDPENEDAVMQLLALKRRPVDKGLILVAASIGQVAHLLPRLTPAQLARLQLSWPGPFTWLIPHGGRVPPWVTGKHDSVAIRVSAHPVVAALCNAWGGPLVSTSANIAGAQSPRERFQVQRYFGGSVDYYVPGRTGGSARASVIRDLLTDRLVRA